MIVRTKGLVQVEFEGRGDKECERTQKHHRERLEAHETKGVKGQHKRSYARRFAGP